MSFPESGPAGAPASRGVGGEEPTLGALAHDLSQQIPQLIRSELRLAQAEVTEKGKRAGIGIGMLSAAGLLAFFGLACLITTAILGLAHAVDGWLAALIVGLVLVAGAVVVGAAGKSQVSRATPALPEKAIEGLKEDVATVKGGKHR